MRHFLAISTVLVFASALTAAEAPGVAYADHEKAAKAGPIAKTSDYAVSIAHRGEAGKVEMHETETDIISITDGTATFLTGGTMVGGKMTKAGQWLGTDIQGGEIHHLSKGDVIVVPAGTPHWFKEVSQGVTYLLVKVIKQ
jgi:mannose-6-phosphate isomerase-like protein (cupin superfamily)